LIQVDPFGLIDEEQPEKLETDTNILKPEDLKWNINPRLKLEFKIKLLELLRKKRSVFSEGGTKLGHLKGVSMTIDADICKIKREWAYRTSPQKHTCQRCN
jgi:hypothetical protein